MDGGLFIERSPGNATVNQWRAQLRAQAEARTLSHKEKQSPAPSLSANRDRSTATVQYLNDRKRTFDPESLAKLYPSFPWNICSSWLRDSWVDCDDLDSPETVISPSPWMQRRVGPEPGLEPFSLRRLYVHDAEDVLELEMWELPIVWRNRRWLCGTTEAAAEVYAFLRLQRGIDHYYEGYLKHLRRPEVLQAGQLLDEVDAPELDAPNSEVSPDAVPVDEVTTSPSLLRPKLEQITQPKTSFNLEAINAISLQSDGAATMVIPSAVENSEESINDEFFIAEEAPKDADLVFDADDVEHMSLPCLHNAWLSRTQSFTDLGAAAAALARLRFENKSDPIRRPAVDYMAHPLINELRDYLPDGALLEVSGDSAWDAEQILEDRRASGLRRSIIREGQSGFRSQLIAKYGCKCPITGATQAEVLQAAHIIPYKGSHSNEIGNGLLLRADIHLLFDCYLLSINPKHMHVEVAPGVDDEFYRRLHGKIVTFEHQGPNRNYIEKHYKRFLMSGGEH